MFSLLGDVLLGMKNSHICRKNKSMAKNWQPNVFQPVVDKNKLSSSKSWKHKRKLSKYELESH